MHRLPSPKASVVLFVVYLLLLPTAAHADPFQVETVDAYAQRLFSQNRTHINETAPTAAESGTDLRNAHKYLGYGTLVMALLASVSASSHGPHRAASYAAVALGGATAATGFMEYGGYIDLSDGFSRWDAHAVLGTVGILAFTGAVVMAEADQSHSGFGVASAVSMGLSAVILKW